VSSVVYSGFSKIHTITDETDSTDLHGYSPDSFNPRHAAKRWSNLEVEHKIR
jgi:hypothetical protein